MWQWYVDTVRGYPLEVDPTTAASSMPMVVAMLVGETFPS